MIGSQMATAQRLGFADRLCSALTAASQPTGATAFARAYNLRSNGAAVTVHGARRWLKGESIPTQERIILLAQWLNVNPAWLRFGNAESRNDEPASLSVEGVPGTRSTLFHDIASLSAPAQIIIRDIVDSFLRIAAKGQIVLIESKSGSRQKRTRR
jgi:hypothetical protein